MGAAVAAYKELAAPPVPTPSRVRTTSRQALSSQQYYHRSFQHRNTEGESAQSAERGWPRGPGREAGEECQ